MVWDFLKAILLESQKGSGEPVDWQFVHLILYVPYHQLSGWPLHQQHKLQTLMAAAWPKSIPPPAWNRENTFAVFLQRELAHAVGVEASVLY